MTQKRYFYAATMFAALIFSSVAVGRNGNFFSRMREDISNLHRQIDKMFSEARPTAKVPTDELTFSQTSDAILVKIKVGTDVTKIEAPIQENEITINVPEKQLRITLNYEPRMNYLSVITESATKKEDKQKGMYEVSTTARSTQQGQTVEAPLDFQNTNVLYEQKTGDLTITIPKIVPKKPETKSIPILMK